MIEILSLLKILKLTTHKFCEFLREKRSSNITSECIAETLLYIRACHIIEPWFQIGLISYPVRKLNKNNNIKSLFIILNVFVSKGIMEIIKLILQQ